jgi:hypothetical protein
MSLSNKLSITDVDVKGKRVLIRVSTMLLPRDCVELGFELPALHIIRCSGQFIAAIL